MKLRLMLDSGAFSAWQQGTKISLGNYIAYLKRHTALIDECVCLDAIPGFRPGEKGVRERNLSKIDAAAKESYENQQRMKAEGLRPIPVFHMDEDYVWLDRYRDDGETYIGISPSKLAGTGEIRSWLDECFARLTAGGRALVKTHCFGSTAWEIAVNYPWHSLDSTTWLKQPLMGQIIVPNGEDYDAYFITDGKIGERGHFDDLPEPQQDAITKYLKDELGIELFEARYDNLNRIKTGMAAFLDMQARLQPKIIYFAVRPSPPRSLKDLLNRYVENRLLSYFHLLEEGDEFLEDYTRFRMSREELERIKLQRGYYFKELEARWKAMTPEEKREQEEDHALWLAMEDEIDAMEEEKPA
jgi:hypothetical protein